MLVSTARLAEVLGHEDVLVFDCRHDLLDHGKGRRLYAESHIPGAHFAPVETALSGPKNGTNGRHPLPAPEAFASFLNEHGAGSATQLVAYDDAGGQYAARFWWLARWIGLARAAVLDGGFPKWLAEGRPVTQDIPAAPGGGTVMPRPDATMVVAVTELEQALADRHLQLVDARSAERYRGESEPIDPVAGRIPGAVNRFIRMNLAPDLTLRPAPELRREFEALLQGRPPAEVAHQCGSGVAACVNVLAMEHAGLRGSRLYAGSWSEWIADPRRPVAKG
ncbi:MAG TPA: sulfurtransferase [Opitutaceae bacterium]|nr:sulfurtransferase [Opitutaceae bacterium]